MINLKRFLLSFRVMDVVILAVVIATIAASAVHIYGRNSGRVHLVITAPSGSWIYPLDADRTVEIPGPLGDTEVQVKDGKVRVLASPCKNKLCVAHAPISEASEWNACLPNQVFIRIESDGKKDELDAVGY